MKRREFIRTGLFTTAAIGTFGKIALADNPGQAELADGCQVTQTGTEVEVHGPAFGFKLDLSKGLGARSWENKLCGRTIALAGDFEVDLELDAAEERIWIPGWKRSLSRALSVDADQDPGFKNGFSIPRTTTPNGENRSTSPRGKSLRLPSLGAGRLSPSPRPHKENRFR